MNNKTADFSQELLATLMLLTTMAETFDVTGRPQDRRSLRDAVIIAKRVLRKAEAGDQMQNSFRIKVKRDLEEAIAAAEAQS